MFQFGKLQISIRSLLGVLLVVAIFLAFAAEEPFSVAGACLFVGLSVFLVSLLLYHSMRDLVKTFVAAWQSGNWQTLTTRFRWFYIDGSLIVWIVISIAVSNFVLQSSIANGKHFIWFAWIAGPILGVLVAIGKFGYKSQAMVVDKAND